MLQLRITGKLQKEIGIKPDALSPISEHDTLLGNWYVNMFTLDRRKAIIFVNEKTLFSFILYGIKKSNINNMGELFLGGLEKSLFIEDIPMEIIQKLKLEYASFELTKTDSKKVLGNMNDLVSLYSHILYLRGGLKYCDVSKVIMRVNRTPQRTIQWLDSISVVRALLGLEVTIDKLLLMPY